jgi:hypothetical protein
MGLPLGATDVHGKKVVLVEGQPLQLATSTAQTSQQGMRAARATNLIGMNLKNPQGDGLGEIEDFVIDLQNGHIVYATNRANTDSVG